MAKQLLSDSRFDFRGGRNVSFTPDALKSNELVDSTNARIGANFGGITKRTGTRKMHQTALDAGKAVTGLTQWNFNGVNQIVAICDGDVHWRDAGGGGFDAFTKVIPANPFDGVITQRFATMRTNTAGAPLELFIADHDGATPPNAVGVIQKWTGSAVSDITGVQNVPACDIPIQYHTRMFYHNPQAPNQLAWSKTGDPEDAQTGTLITDGSAALVGQTGDDDILSMEVVGSSLLLFTGDSIVRFTGYSSDDIRMDQDTEGVSSEIGTVGRQTTIKAEKFIFTITDRGPFVVNEEAYTPIGTKVEKDFDGTDNSSSAIASAIVGFHRGRREVWFAMQDTGDTGNQTVFVYSMRTGAWCGPFTYPFAITALSRYEDDSGDEWIMAGCSDGFIRHLDTGAKDDVLWDASGGSNYTMTVEFAPHFFSPGPAQQKSLRRVVLQGDIPSGAAVKVGTAWDGDVLVTNELTELGAGTVRNYRADATGVGYRLRVQVTDASAVIPIITGYTVEAWDMRRT